MPSIPAKDRVSLCRYSYADQRKCLTPRSPSHPHFCYFHARRESQSVATEKLAENLAYFFSGRYVSANDLSYALGQLLPAVVRGDIKPRTASTLAYLAQTFIQAIQLAQKEYIYAFGTPEWGAQIRNNVSCNIDHLKETDPDANAPAPNEQPAANPNSDTADCEEQTPRHDNDATPHDPNLDHANPGHLSCSGAACCASSCSGGSSDPCSCGVGSDEDSNDEDTDQDKQIKTDESTSISEPLTPIEATLVKN